MKFETNMHREVMMHKNTLKNVQQVLDIPPELVRLRSLYNTSLLIWDLSQQMC